jgi:UDPglucose 6-dehydrogenase
VFRGLDLKRMARDMRQPVLVDFRNLFPMADARASGMAYHSIGRAVVEVHPVVA